MLTKKVSFYRTQLPSYAQVVHPGGAPEWLVLDWMDLLRNPKRVEEREKKRTRYPILKLIEKDLARVAQTESNRDEALQQLMDVETEWPDFAVEEVSNGVA
jgi:hypothetical protein